MSGPLLAARISKSAFARPPPSLRHYLFILFALAHRRWPPMLAHHCPMPGSSSSLSFADSFSTLDLMAPLADRQPQLLNAVNTSTLHHSLKYCSFPPQSPCPCPGGLNTIFPSSRPSPAPRPQFDLPPVSLPSPTDHPCRPRHSSPPPSLPFCYLLSFNGSLSFPPSALVVNQPRGLLSVDRHNNNNQTTITRAGIIRCGTHESASGTIRGHSRR